MLRTFIYNELKKNWIEDDEFLFFHDICVFLDEENHVIYLWRGPKTKRTRYREAYRSLDALISKDSQQIFQINVLAKYIPQFIQEKLEKMLNAAKNQEEIGKYKFSKLTTIKIYLILLIITIILPLLAVLLLSFCFSWSKLNGNFLVSSFTYNNWLLYPKILIIITLVCYILSIVIGLFEKETQVIVFSIVGVIICIGIVIYIQQGVYLFLFQEGSTSTLYIISIKDITLFFFLTTSAIIVFELPNIVKFVLFIGIYKKFIF